MPTRLEREVMSMLLADDHPVLAMLRSQFAQSTVAKREFNGAGFFTTFAVPEIAPRLPNKDTFFFGDVDAIIPQLQCGAGFVVRISDGVLEFLEGFTYEEPWPDHIDTFALHYTRTPRDLHAILGGR